MLLKNLFNLLNILEKHFKKTYDDHYFIAPILRLSLKLFVFFYYKPETALKKKKEVEEEEMEEEKEKIKSSDLNLDEKLWEPP